MDELWICYSNEYLALVPIGSATQIYGMDTEYEEELSRKRNSGTMDAGNFINSCKSATEVSY